MVSKILDEDSYLMGASHYENDLSKRMNEGE